MNSNWLLILLAPSLFWMVVVESCEMPPYPSPEYPAFPSHGDLRLCPSGLVMIYKGPDGTNIEHMWGTFSGTLVGHQEYVENTLCQQLGYADGKLTHGNSSNEAEDYPVWISRVECDSTYQHILRCNCTPTDSPNTARHTDDWHLTCFKNSKVRPDNGYVKQVALIPPASVSTFGYSKSVGVVVYLQEPQEWRFIVNDSSSFDFNIADTACRAMGFTHSVWNSVTTVKQYTTSYGGNYSFGDSMNGSSASSVDCSESFQCLGCCQFNSPKDNSAKEYAMVVRCSFYEPTPHNPLTSGGYKELCETGSHIGEHSVPSHGDLALCDDGVVMIYMGPDGNYQYRMWGTFSGTSYKPNKVVADTLCQQLGYDDGIIVHRASSEKSMFPVFISNVTCPTSYNPGHILRCTFDFNTTTSHDEDWHLTCSSFSTREGPGRDANTYFGQVALIPPMSYAKLNFSLSFGVVSIKVRHAWEYFSSNGFPLDIANADTICRTMGYTHAVKNSVTTVQQYITSYGGAFNTGSLSSMPLSMLNCSVSCQCIGCCVNLGQQIYREKSYSDGSAVIIQCSFYKPYYDTLISGGSKSDCEVGKNGDIRNLSQCTQNKSPRMISLEEREFIAVVAAPVGVVLLVAFGIVGVVIGYKKVEVWKRRRGYQRVRDGNAGHGNRGHGNGRHGNGGHGNGGHGNEGHGNRGHGNGGCGGPGNGGNGGGL